MWIKNQVNLKWVTLIDLINGVFVRVLHRHFVLSTSPFCTPSDKGAVRYSPARDRASPARHLDPPNESGPARVRRSFPRDGCRGARARAFFARNRLRFYPKTR